MSFINLKFFVSQALLLRVVISADEVRRIELSQVPETVDALVYLLKKKFKLEGDFVLQFEDPSFNNALCNLSDISELPPDRAVLHIRWKGARPPKDESDSLRLSATSSLDTARLSTSIDPSPTTSRNVHGASEWPSPFPIPSLSLEVELELRKGNEAYDKTKKGINVTSKIKTEILEKIAQASFAIKQYPEPDERKAIAVALITKYPCLREANGSGYDGWREDIRKKLNTVRSKLSRKQKADKDTAEYTPKRSKQTQITFLPEHPNPEHDASHEEQRILLVEASAKARDVKSFIREKMELTFSLRRKEVLNGQPKVIEIQDRWPALFFKDQIDEEFFRITKKMLLRTFRAAVEKYTPKLIRLYRAKKANLGRTMEDILTKLDDESSDIIRDCKDAALRGLPIFLNEKPKELFKQCLTSEDDMAVKGMAVGILYVLEDCGLERSPKVQNIAVILEERVVLQDISDTPTALAYLFGLLYILNISYPKALLNTFDALQNVFMEIDRKCTPCVQTLKKQLLL
ncbi:hypothetical protein ACEWY4_023359 [Coilia grayii]|uniref:Sterile alpha motif domain-containing protein 3-like n=1 Tax=Coilia grayii TaxID=363190 RepID=A0ABD1J2T3_9TELE